MFFKPLAAPALSPVIWDDETLYRRAILRIILWVIALVALLLCLSNLHHEEKAISLFEAGITLYCLLFLARLPHTPWLSLWTASLLTLIFVTATYGIFCKGMYADGFYWLLVMPPASLLLMGLLWGGVLTLLFGAMGISVLVWAQPALDGSIDVALAVNATVSYLCIWAMSHIFEYKRSRTVRQLQEVAARDPLTGLHNRLHLENIFHQITDAHQHQRQVMTLLLLDIDHFKHINDEHGHEAGDLILCHLGQRMNAHCRRADWLFRVGGEEFCILLPDTNSHQALNIAERLRQDIASQAPQFQQHPIHFTVSIGLAEWPLDGTDFDALYRRADQHLYEAKRRGRNQTVAQRSEPRVQA